MELSERKKKILAAVVNQYIETGEPVGSKVLLQLLDISVSSATIRNEMSELSLMGLLDQPHTSAGRVPTQLGYRYYVDNLMPQKELNEDTKRLMDAGVKNAGSDPEKLLANAGEILAYLTKCAAVMTTPAGESARIKRVEMVPISTRTVMIVLLTSNGILRNKLCRMDCEINASMCERFYTIADAAFIGFPLRNITTAYLQSLAARMGMDTLTMFPLLSCVADLAQSAVQSQVIFEGRSNLLHHREYDGNLCELLEFLSREKPLEQLIDQSKGDIEIRIGRENFFPQLRNSSIILARYSIGDDGGGSIGVIGPTRIDYSRLVPSLKYISELISNTMTKALED